MFASYNDLNLFYEDCVNAIRVTNPYRIIFIAPTYNSDPMYLQYLRIPSRANGYLMAEWQSLSQFLESLEQSPRIRRALVESSY